MTPDALPGRGHSAGRVEEFNFFDTINDNQPCFVSGTMIVTRDGEFPVENLRAGDLLLDVFHGPPMRSIIWVGRVEVDLRRHRERQRAAPVRIDAGATEEGVPAACAPPTGDASLQLSRIRARVAHKAERNAHVDAVRCNARISEARTTA